MEEKPQVGSSDSEDSALVKRSRSTLSVLGLRFA